MANIFVYGTLLFPEVAGPVAGLDGNGIPFTLTGYRRYEATIRERGNFPAIVKDEHACVDGLLFRNVTAEQVARLDQFEDVKGKLYLRESVDIFLKGESLAIEFYLAGPRLFDYLIEPLSKSWNPALFMQNELHWYVKNVVRN